MVELAGLYKCNIFYEMQMNHFTESWGGFAFGNVHGPSTSSFMNCIHFRGTNDDVESEDHGVNPMQ